ncbi:hypothetical protein PINS_up000627 [Pythium insidiosum]|nr:hypothetical protein PINS_up000627 [Pythium insidiosum]
MNVDKGGEAGRRCVIEAELSPSCTTESIGLAKESCPVPSTVVGVVPVDSAPSNDALQGVDVCIFSLSIVVRFVLEQLARDGGHRITLLTNGMTRIAAERVRDALLWRHDVVTQLVDTTALRAMNEWSASGLLVLIVDSTEEAREICARLQKEGKAVEPKNVVVVLDDSSAQVDCRAPDTLPECKAVLHVAEAADRMLQQVRERIRSDTTPEAIQQEILVLLGEQRSLLCRPDRFSRWDEHI